METSLRTNSLFSHLPRNKSRLVWKWRWKLGGTQNCELRTIACTLYYILSLVTTSLGHPLNSASQSECDWTGRGTISGGSSALGVTTVSLGLCSRGRISWEDPKGGLRLRISPNLAGPYSLCLEDGDGEGGGRGPAHRILLEEAPGTLLHVLSSQRRGSACYRIQGPEAVVYVESHGSLGTGRPSPPIKSSTISIAYEVEALRGDGDPCRPCSEAEVLKTYCSADAVVRGSILKVQPGKVYDSIYIESDLVIHQNQPVFTPLPKPVQKFLSRSPVRFDMDRPQKLTRSKKGQLYGGILSHPASCAAASGEGDFLWLIKFRFGRAMTDCVIYWDKWLDIARKGAGECPLSTGQL